MTIGVARVDKFGANNRMHSDSKKRRSSFLVALLFAAGGCEALSGQSP